VFASGGFPEMCEHDHRWRAKGAVIIGWMPCDWPRSTRHSRQLLDRNRSVVADRCDGDAVGSYLLPMGGYICGANWYPGNNDEGLIYAVLYEHFPKAKRQ
jgi:hypothetical protein